MAFYSTMVTIPSELSVSSIAFIQRLFVEVGERWNGIYVIGEKISSQMVWQKQSPLFAFIQGSCRIHVANARFMLSSFCR